MDNGVHTVLKPRWSCFSCHWIIKIDSTPQTLPLTTAIYGLVAFVFPGYCTGWWHSCPWADSGGTACDSHLRSLISHSKISAVWPHGALSSRLSFWQRIPAVAAVSPVHHSSPPGPFVYYLSRFRRQSFPSFQTQFVLVLFHSLQEASLTDPVLVTSDSSYLKLFFILLSYFIIQLPDLLCLHFPAEKGGSPRGIN